MGNKNRPPLTSNTLPLALLLVLLTALTLAPTAAAAENNTPKTTQRTPPSKKLKIIATLFPQYDFARQIARNQAEIKLLLPPGAESHSFEPTPADIRDITNADVFIYTGKHMEPWAERLANSSTSGHTLVVDAVHGINMNKDKHEGEDKDDDKNNNNNDNDKDKDKDENQDKGEDEDSHESHQDHGHADGHDHSADPHVWLDPVMAGTMAENIGAALAEKDSENAAFYLANTAALCAEIDKLDHDIAKHIAELPRRILVFGDRFAFSYFFTRYGLDPVSPYKSCTAGSEPGLRAVIDTIALIKREGIKYIYAEDMTTSRMADVIARESGVDVLRVDSLHNPSLDKQMKGAGYVSIMRDNLAAFVKGLE